eukprot:262281_1
MNQMGGMMHPMHPLNQMGMTGSPWGMVGAGMVPGMQPGTGMMPMMGGLAPGIPGYAAPKKPIVVVHGGGNAHVKTEMVDEKTANKIKKHGNRVQRRRMLNDEEIDIHYVNNQVYIHKIMRCKVLEIMESIHSYELCLHYDMEQMKFSLDINHAERKVLRRHKTHDWFGFRESSVRRYGADE